VVSPISIKFNTFHLKKVWESEYHFDLVPAVKDQLNRFPAGTSFRVALEEGDRVGLNPLEEQVTGWRARAGAFYLYLHLPASREEISGQGSRDLAAATVAKLLSLGFCVPKPGQTSPADLERMVRFRPLLFWENPYPFEPGQGFPPGLLSLAPGSMLLVSPEPRGGFSLSALDQDQSGHRVRVGQLILQLSLGRETQEEEGPVMRQAMALNDLCLAHGLYQTRAQDILEYWRRPDDELNRAEGYARDRSRVRSRYLAGLIRAHCPGLGSALEIGCNVGRNLDHLKAELGLQVAGIEVSRHALDLAPELFPGLRGSTLIHGPAQEAVLDLASKSFDLVFSMAVLMHLHPSTPESFWSHLVRLSRSRIITIENEDRGSDRNWARNYQELLEPLGAVQIHAERVGVDDEEGIYGYTARVFKVD